MAKKVKAGCPELRKLMRRFKGYSLVNAGGTGGHAVLVDPSGEFVRMPDGRKLTVVSSPRDPDVAARELERRLESLGVKPR